MLVDVMLHYASRGWALLPMRGKIFAFRGSLRDAATRDPHIIETWWWAQGVGLACGELSGVDVLDVDDPSRFPLDLAALLAATLHAIADARPELIELIERTASDPPISFPWPFMAGDPSRSISRCWPLASRHDQRRVMGALRKLVHAKHHRNNALNRAAFCFRTFVTEGLTTTEQARALLEMASAMNGYTAKDGIAEVRSTIASGLGCQ